MAMLELSKLATKDPSGMQPASVTLLGTADLLFFGACKRQPYQITTREA